MTRRRLSTHDYGAEHRWGGVENHRHPLPSRDTRYAAIEFENMVREAKKDGVITQAEAADLSIEHNRLQQNSREALRKMLEAYGYKQVVFNGDPDTPLASRISHVIGKRRIPEMPTPDIDYQKKGINFIKGEFKIPKIPQKVTWLSIVGPAVLASLLGVLGVI